MLLNCKPRKRIILIGWGKFAPVFLGLLLVLCLSSAALVRNGMGAERPGKRHLMVLFWPDYLPAWVYKEFTDKTGIKVVFDSYGNYQSMYNQIKDHVGNFDLIQPSNGYAHRMWHEGLLKEINLKKIPNYANIDPRWKKTGADQYEKYSVPLFWGLTGFLVNKDKINPEEVKDYRDLWKDEVRKQLVMVNEARTAFSVALKSLGLSCNDLSPASRKKALDQMAVLLADCSVRNLEDGLEDMENGTAAVMVTWAAAGSQFTRGHPNMVLVLPPSPLLWMDCLTMPTNGLAPQHAEAFINFLLDPKIAARVAENIGYSTPNAAAQALLPQEMRENPLLYPGNEVLARSEFEAPLYEFAGELDNAWELMIDRATQGKTVK